MPNDQGKNEPPYDLEERTALFGEAIIAFAKTIPRDVVTLPLISQLVRAGTSIGANYCEADDAVSRKEFLQKINTCQKEAKETKHWLRMVVAAENALRRCEAAVARGEGAAFDLLLDSPWQASLTRSVWSLELGISLGIGHWSFCGKLPPPARPAQSTLSNFKLLS